MHFWLATVGNRRHCKREIKRQGPIKLTKHFLKCSHFQFGNAISVGLISVQKFKHTQDNLLNTRKIEPI